MFPYYTHFNKTDPESPARTYYPSNVHWVICSGDDEGVTHMQAFLNVGYELNTFKCVGSIHKASATEYRVRILSKLEPDIIGDDLPPDGSEEMLPSMTCPTLDKAIAVVQRLIYPLSEEIANTPDPETGKGPDFPLLLTTEDDIPT